MKLAIVNFPMRHQSLRCREWRRGGDSNSRYGCPYAAFRVRCFQPLSHLSAGRQVDKAMDERRASYLAAGGGGNKRQAKDQPHSSSEASCSRPCERASPARVTRDGPARRFIRVPGSAVRVSVIAIAVRTHQSLVRGRRAERDRRSSRKVRRVSYRVSWAGKRGSARRW